MLKENLLCIYENFNTQQTTVKMYNNETLVNSYVFIHDVEALDTVLYLIDSNKLNDDNTIVLYFTVAQGKERVQEQKTSELLSLS